jgi:hypothetical protein
VTALWRVLRGERTLRAVFVAVAVSFLAIGLLDIASAVGLAPRVFGAFLAVVGLLAAIAAIGFRRQPWAPWPTLAVAFTIFTMGIIGLVTDARDLITIGWLDWRHFAFDLVSLSCGGYLLSGAPDLRTMLPPGWVTQRGEPAKTPLENLKDAIELLGVAGLVVAGTGFWYTNVYIPSSRLPALNASVAVEGSLSPAPGAVHSRVVLQNTTDFRVRVVSSLFNVTMSRREAPYAPATSRCVVAAQGLGYVHDGPGSPRAFEETTRPVVSSGRLLPDGQWFEPGEELEIGIVSILPPDAPLAGVVRVEATLVIARGDRLPATTEWDSTWAQRLELAAAPDDVATCSPAGGLDRVGATTWPVVQESVFNLLTRDPVKVIEFWEMQDDGAFVTETILEQNGELIQDPPTLTRLEPKIEQLLGLASTTAVDEVSFPINPKE